MKVKVTWRNSNPFAPIEQLGRVSEGELTDDTTFEVIKQFAEEATPKGYFLKRIETPTVDVEYGYMGNVIEQD